MITGYSKEDIENLIKRVYKEAEENRDRAIKLYDHMENAMVNNKGDLIVLSQMADRYLEQASRQTEILVKLGQVIQRLQQYEVKPEDPEGSKKAVTDINALLEQMDLRALSPFFVRGNPKDKKSEPLEVKADPIPIEPETTIGDVTNLELPSEKKGDVELETDL